jgi:hypothetical protein
MPVGLEIPTLGEGYIDHRIRVAEVTSSSDPGRESVAIQQALERCMFACLVPRQATFARSRTWAWVTVVEAR